MACTVYTRELCVENLQSTFRRTGIYPLDGESPKPGPSHTSSYGYDTDEMTVENCFFCGCFQTKEQTSCVSLTFVKVDRCDGIVIGRPCNHWTHLKYCTPVK
ncbi:hypothetical protein MAR_037938, partial [Mya arenaria]